MKPISIIRKLNESEGHKMNMIKYSTTGYTEATNGKYKGEPIVDYREEDFKKGTSVLTPFVCDYCGTEFYVKSSIHDFFEQGDFDDPYEVPKENFGCPKCKDFNSLSYNGEVWIKEPGVKENITEASTNSKKTFNYNGTKCWMEIGVYANAPTVLAIEFYCDEGPYTTATVNLGEDSGNNSVIPFGASFLDTNNNSGIDDFFKKLGLGEIYTRFGDEVRAQSGFCEYPLFQFNIDKLKEYDPKGFSEYESSYNANLEKARSKVSGLE